MARRKGVASAAGDLAEVVLSFLFTDGTYDIFDDEGVFPDADSARQGWEHVRRAVWASPERTEVWPPEAAAAYDGLRSRIETQGHGTKSVSGLRDLIVDDLADVARFRREKPRAASAAGAGLDEYDQALRRLLEVLESDGRVPTMEAWSTLFGRGQRGAA